MNPDSFEAEDFESVDPKVLVEPVLWWFIAGVDCATQLCPFSEVSSDQRDDLSGELGAL